MQSLPNADSSVQFELVQPQEADGQLIMQWRNHPVTRAASFHTEEKKWESFQREFMDYFRFPTLPPLFIVKGGARVGILRFTPCVDLSGANRKWCAISINISPEYRQQGLGTRSLIAIAPWIKSQGYDDIYAEVIKNNTPSLKTFTKAGYSKLADGNKLIFETGQHVAIYRLLKPLTKPYLEKKVFVIAEAGSNWHVGTALQDMKMAKSLIDVAKEAGADAVKFQLFHPETLYVSNAGSSNYLQKNGINTEMSDLFRDLVLPRDMLQQLYEYTASIGIEFMATPFSAEDFDTIDPLVLRHKIASYEIAHIHLLKKAAASGKPLYLSTGCATEDEIAWSVAVFRAAGGQSLKLLQCTAAYPAPPGAMNLRSIPWLKKRFGVEVGLSDHSRHPTAAPIAAVTLGASVIEKHFTLDNTLPGPDHAFALEPHQLKEMVSAIHTASDMLGSHVKIIAPEEMELRDFARRGIQATMDIAAGDILHEGRNIALLRPGKQPLGLPPHFLADIHGKKALRAIPQGHGLSFGDF